MAFFDEEISKISQRKVPKSVSSCLEQDNLSQALWQWAQNLENWGRIVCLILVIIGGIMTIYTGTSTYDDLQYADNGGFLAFIAFVLAALQWGFYAFLEYCLYHALSLLLGALASIVQSNKITSDLAVYQASCLHGDTGTAPDRHFTVEDLGELAKRKAQGLISDAEYEAKRAEIMKYL